MIFRDNLGIATFPRTMHFAVRGVWIQQYTAPGAWAGTDPGTDSVWDCTAPTQDATWDCDPPSEDSTWTAIDPTNP